MAREHGVAGLVGMASKSCRARWDDAVAAVDRRRCGRADLAGGRGDRSPPGSCTSRRSRGSRGSTSSPGTSFHSARWDHDYDLSGKRVAVIGTGASAVQFVPEIAEQAGHLYVFQRTGNWFLPRRNRAYPAVGAGR